MLLVGCSGTSSRLWPPHLVFVGTIIVFRHQVHVDTRGIMWWTLVHVSMRRGRMPVESYSVACLMRDVSHWSPARQPAIGVLTLRAQIRCGVIVAARGVVGLQIELGVHRRFLSLLRTKSSSGSSSCSWLEVREDIVAWGIRVHCFSDMELDERNVWVCGTRLNLRKSGE